MRGMEVGARRAELVARLCLTVGALAPYWPLLTFRTIYVTDDFFASDIFNGELPGRVLSAELVREGRLPGWTSQLCSGLPLAGTPADPAGLAHLVSCHLPRRALRSAVVFLLLVAAHGTYAWRVASARMIGLGAGAESPSPDTGYIACQLKHLSIVATIFWLPLGLALIDRRYASGSRPECPLPAAGYRCRVAVNVYTGQVLSAFRNRRISVQWWMELRAVQGTTLAMMDRGARLAAARRARDRDRFGCRGGSCGPPARELGSVSDQSEQGGIATRIAYWPPNILRSCFPISTATSPTTATSAPSFSGGLWLRWSRYPSLAIYAGCSGTVVRSCVRGSDDYTPNLHSDRDLTSVYGILATYPGDDAIPAAHRFLFVAILAGGASGWVARTARSRRRPEAAMLASHLRVAA